MSAPASLTEAIVGAWRASLALEKDAFGTEIRNFVQEFDRDDTSASKPQSVEADDVTTIDQLDLSYRRHSKASVTPALAIPEKCDRALAQLGRILQQVQSLVAQESVHSERRTQARHDRSMEYAEFVKNIPQSVTAKKLQENEIMHKKAMAELERWYATEILNIRKVG